MSKAERKRIVILGGGFGGVYAAMYLEKLRGRRDDFEIILINKENYFVFQPMLAEVVSGNIGLTDMVSPLRRLLPRTQIQVREIEAIDTVKQTITCAPGLQPHSHEIAYDHLILALGNVTDFRGLRGLAEHALPFKNLSDALRIRNHVIRALDEAAVETDAALRKELLTFVVAGGGFSGIEVVAELKDFVRRVIKNYSQLEADEVRFVLLHATDRILPELAPQLALYAQKLLAGRGVEVKLQTKLQAATNAAAVLDDGTRIATKTLISTVPAFPHPLIEALPLPKDKRGRLNADAMLAVEGADNIWALGDCARVPMPDGSASPPTAQFAIRQARTLAHNLVVKLRGAGEPQAFSFKELGKLAALGHRSAVAEIFGFKLSGFAAWWLWRTIYLLKLPGWGRRLRVALDWTLDLLLPPDLVQLNLQSSGGVAHEHFEPGQEVFRQGDAGDRMYIIVKGAVEVSRTDDDGETPLARLGAGEYFGETALLNHTTRNATVRCLEPLDVLGLPKMDFGLLTANLPVLHESLQNLSRSRQADNTRTAKRN